MFMPGHAALRCAALRAGRLRRGPRADLCLPCLPSPSRVGSVTGQLAVAGEPPLQGGGGEHQRSSQALLAVRRCAAMLTTSRL